MTYHIWEWHSYEDEPTEDTLAVLELADGQITIGRYHESFCEWWIQHQSDTTAAILAWAPIHRRES